jgi:hypothetical protein|tara:strand:- start:610 stop:786 length:177 start_codon:yes stop_codon:yes gene_type:complete
LGSPKPIIGNYVRQISIFLISILLLSSPVIGQETGVFYLYETSAGFASKGFEDNETKP